MAEERTIEGALSAKRSPTEPPAETSLVPLKEKATDAWHRTLDEGRVEVMCKSPGFRLRVTAPEQQAWEAVEMFERWTGLTINSDRRPRKRVSPPPGQLAMTEL